MQEDKCVFHVVKSLAWKNLEFCSFQIYFVYVFGKHKEWIML